MSCEKHLLRPCAEQTRWPVELIPRTFHGHVWRGDETTLGDSPRDNSDRDAFVRLPLAQAAGEATNEGRKRSLRFHNYLRNGG